MSSQRPDNGSFFEDDPDLFPEEESELFLFDSVQELSNTGSSGSEDSFSSPFVEEDPEWFRKLMEQNMPSDSVPAGWDPSSSYTILSRQEAAEERTTDRVSRETAATVQSALGTAGMIGTSLRGRAPDEPAAESATAEKGKELSPRSSTGKPAHRVPAPVRKAHMVSGSSRSPAPSADSIPVRPETSENITSPVRHPAEREVTVTDSPVQNTDAAPEKTAVPPARPAKKKGGAHVAPKKSRFGLRKTAKPEKTAERKPQERIAAPAATPSPSRPRTAPVQKTPVNPRPNTAAVSKPSVPTGKASSSASAEKTVRNPVPEKRPAAPPAPAHKRTAAAPATQKKASAGKRPAGRKKKISKKKQRTRVLVTVLSILVFLEVGYGLFVYSNIPFFEKWRTIYIETAMSTLNHQWLATKFIPGDIIDEVMKDVEAANAGQKNIKTSWKGVGSNSNAHVVKKSNKSSWFYDLYWEIDKDSFEDYLDDHESLRKQGYNKLVINNLDEKDERLKTKFGEAIRVLDVPENLLIVEVTGGNYVGSLAICKNADQITMKKAQDFGDMGDQILEYTKKNVLAINGSGFQDPNGEGLGGTIVGSFVLNGKEYGKPEYNYLFFGYRDDNRLYINWGIDDFSGYKWGIQFAPALIVNGETVVEGTNGWGLQPRTAIGQTEEGEFLLLIVDGRQVGYSLGCTVEDCANIMERHEAYQAVNMDGGSSSIMAYRDRIITRNSSALPEGRYLPNAIVVQHEEDVEESKKKDDD